MAVEYFCAYHSYLDALEPLTDAERGRLFVACLEYSKSGVASHLSGNERFIFPMIRAQIDRDNEKYTAKCKSMADNAKKRLQANASNCQQMLANEAKEKEKTKTKEKAKENNIHPSDVCVEPPCASTAPAQIDYGEIQAMYNELCPSLPRCQVLSEARKKAIKARLSSGYTPEDFRRLFERAEASGFLKGRNDRDWSATFDWLIADSHMAKVLDGNYDDHGGAYGRKGNAVQAKPSGQRELDQAEREAIRRLMEEST